MNPVGSELKLIFGRALERDEGAARSAFLDEVCAGDQDLRNRVEALLRMHNDAGGFLESASVPVDESAALFLGQENLPLASTADALDPVIPQRPGSWIGPYRLLQKIGEGGMGVVFMAEQEKPIRRKVALKVIKPGMDTGQVIARFEAERQALAMMDHPHIARVLDGGATATGRPFFVMELVRGLAITDYCDKNHLTPRERLELFVPVCRAIQHAHQKGIIHRDIKPSNVLVTLHDGVPVSKVIDFGVAKAIDQRLTERTMFTEFGAVLGTLEYMSPEQAEVGALDIDTRTDVYSLGVLLYELLTGTTPLERTKIRAASYSEILRRVRDEDPPRPSTRLSGSNAALMAISTRRKTEPARLSRLVRGELDWIVMKSLEKDRTRRYESAVSFARDVQRYLDGDAVEASPPSTLYRVRKFARKYRGSLATGAMFGVLLIGATIVSAILAIWANNERLRATRSQALAGLMRARSEANEELAIRAMMTFAEATRNNPELKYNSALAELRKRLLGEPYAFFQALDDRLKRDQDSSPASLERFAAASFELAELSRELGDKAGALRAYEQARGAWERLSRGAPQDRRYAVEQARSAQEAGFRLETDDPARAMIRFQEARAIRERLLQPAPAQAPVADQAALGLCYHSIGNLEKSLHHDAQALDAFRQALAIWRRITDANPASIRYQGDLTWSLINIGELAHDPSLLEQALQAYQRAQPIRARQVRENPTSWARLDQVTNQFNMGTLQAQFGSKPDSVETFTEAARMWGELIRDDPGNLRYPTEQAATYLNLGNLNTELNHPDQAGIEFAQAAATLRTLIKRSPTDPELGHTLAQTYSGTARLAEQRGDLEAACGELRTGIWNLEQNLASHRAHRNSLNLIRQQYTDLARLEVQLGHAEQAAADRRQLDRFSLPESKP